jgi:hypothetical protein
VEPGKKGEGEREKGEKGGRWKGNEKGSKGEGRRELVERAAEDASARYRSRART